MDSRRQKVMAIAIAGALLVLIATFSKSWFRGESGAADAIKATLSIGLTGGQSCAGDQCQSVSLGQIDDNWNYVGLGALLCGLATVGVAGYLVFLVMKGRAGAIDPKKLALPAGAGAAAAAAFLLIKPAGVTAKMSWAGFVAILGFGASAGAIFLAQKWLAGMMPARPPLPQQYGGYYNGGYYQQGQPMQQPPMQQPMQQPPMQQQVPPSYPPQQQAYYPPQSQPPPSYPPQQQAYGSEPPVQRIMPTMPKMAGNPSSQPPPGSQPPVPMMQKQSTTIPPGSNPCPRCGTGLAYSSSHSKWYCARCQAYV